MLCPAGEGGRERQDPEGRQVPDDVGHVRPLLRGAAATAGAHAKQVQGVGRPAGGDGAPGRQECPRAAQGQTGRPIPTLQLRRR